MEKYVSVNPNIIAREDCDEWVLLFDPDTGKAFGLNPVGFFVWNHLDGRHSMGDILQKIRSSMEGLPEQVGLQVKDFIKQLIDLGLAKSAQ